MGTMNKTDDPFPAVMEFIVWGERQPIKIQLNIVTNFLRVKQLRFSEEEELACRGMFASS